MTSQNSDLFAAIAAWNAMWAGRAGEATKRVFSVLAMVVGEIKHGGGKLYVEDDDQTVSNYLDVDEVRVALAELGIDPTSEEAGS